MKSKWKSYDNHTPFEDDKDEKWEEQYNAGELPTGIFIQEDEEEIDAGPDFLVDDVPAHFSTYGSSGEEEMGDNHYSDDDDDDDNMLYSFQHIRSQKVLRTSHFVLGEGSPNDESISKVDTSNSPLSSARVRAEPSFIMRITISST